MEILLLLILIVLVVRWMVISRRFAELNRKIAQLSPDQSAPPSDARLRTLEKRVAYLEILVVQQGSATRSRPEQTVPAEPVRPSPDLLEATHPEAPAVQVSPPQAEIVPPTVQGSPPMPE